MGGAGDGRVWGKISEGSGDGEAWGMEGSGEEILEEAGGWGKVCRICGRGNMVYFKFEARGYGIIILF